VNILRTLDNSVSSESLDRRRRSNPAARSANSKVIKTDPRAELTLLCSSSDVGAAEFIEIMAPGGAGPHARSETESTWQHGEGTGHAAVRATAAMLQPRGADSEGVADNRDVRVAARGQVRSGASGRRRGRLLVPGLSESPNLSHRA
jgi:hypothetical protein